jgi:hypothetical protein
MAKQIFQIFAFTQLRRSARFHSRDNRLKGVAASVGGRIQIALEGHFHIWGKSGMLSRALSLAAVLLLIGSFAPKPALAQENLDAGKTPSQLFAGTCNACHKSPRGLLKTVPPSSLPSFLRQHYTTSPNMAGALASYLISNGATDTRIGGDGPKGAKGAKEGAKQQEARQEGRPEPRQGGQSEQLDRWGRRLHPGPGPQEANAPVAEAKPGGAEQADRGKNAKQKLSKRDRPGETLPKEEPAAAVEPPKPESRPEAKSDTKPDETAAKEESKPDTAKPAEEGRSQSANVEQPAETRVLRPDPVPPVTPAPPTTAAVPVAPSAPAPAPTAPSALPPTASSAPVQAAASSPDTEMAVPLPASPSPPAPPPPPVAASAPPQPPVPPAGPPAPPISQ